MRKTKWFGVLRVAGVSALLAMMLAVSAPPAVGAITEVYFTPAATTGTAADGSTGRLSTAPVTLYGGTTTLTVATAGDITITLPPGTSGIATGGTATVTASPVALAAGANTVTATIGTFVVLLAGTPNAISAYTVDFTIGAGLRGGVDTITIIFPPGTFVPTIMAPANITVNGRFVDKVSTRQAGPSMTITPAASVTPGSVRVIIGAAAGLRNPANSGTTFTGTVATSIEPNPVVSAAYAMKTAAPAANDVGIAHKGREYVANPATLANIPMVQVGDTLTIRSLTGGTHTGNLTFGANAYAGPALGDFIEGAAMKAKIGGNPVTIAPADATVGAGAAGDPGRGKFNITLTIPTLNGSSNFGKTTFTGDDHLVEITDGTFRVQFLIWVVPKAIVSPDTGTTGTTVTVTGSGFTGGRGITLYSKNASFATGGVSQHATGVATPNLVGATVVSSGVITTNADGTFTGTFSSLPTTIYVAAVDGDYNWAFDAVMARDETDTTFFPLATVEAPEAPTTVASALISITGRYTVVWAYDSKAPAWLKYDPTAPAYANTLATLKSGEAYWIQAAEDAKLVWGAREWDLKKGSNPITW